MPLVIRLCIGRKVQLTSRNFEIPQRKVWVVEIRLLGDFGAVIHIRKISRPVTRSRHFSCSHRELCLAFPIPTFDRERRALWVGGGIEIHVGRHLRLRRCEILMVGATSRGCVWDEGLVDFGCLTQALCCHVSTVYSETVTRDSYVAKMFVEA